MDHLDEVTGSLRPAVQEALFGGIIGLLSAGSVWRCFYARSKRGEDRSKVSDDLLFATARQAIAPLKSGNTTARPDIQVMNSFGFQLGVAPNIIAIIGIATVYDDVARFKQRDEHSHLLIDHGHRDHQPNHARLG